MRTVAQPRASARGPLTVGMGLWEIYSNLGRRGEAEGALVRKRAGGPPAWGPLLGQALARSLTQPPVTAHASYGVLATDLSGLS